jgi:hypothetical protein
VALLMERTRRLVVVLAVAAISLCPVRQQLLELQERNDGVLSRCRAGLLGSKTVTMV